MKILPLLLTVLTAQNVSTGLAQSRRKAADLVKKTYPSGYAEPGDRPVSEYSMPREKASPDYMKPSVITEDEVTSALTGAPPKKSGFWIGNKAGSPPPVIPQTSLNRRLPENTGALKALFHDAFSTMDKGDKDAVARAGRRLVMSNPERWFAEVFGTEKSTELLAEYNKTKKAVESDFVGLIKGLKSKGQTQVYVVTLRSPADPEANPHQRAALSAMRNPVPLYSVRFSKPGKPGGFHVYSFTYMNGDFRFVGKMQALGTAGEETQVAAQEPPPDSFTAGTAGPDSSGGTDPILMPPVDTNDN